MNNRIDQKFLQLRKARRKAFIAFITSGDPDLKTTRDLAIAFEGAGVDIVELGVPFSDPLADGPTIQASSQRALKKNVSLKDILDVVRQVRQRSQIPIALMTYYNPVFQYGESRLMQDASSAGVDGIIIPDLPPEEAKTLIKAARKYNIKTVFFVAPTTTTERLKKNVKASTGFVYYVSMTGVTGSGAVISPEIKKHVQLSKKFTRVPVCVGFGISTPQQVKEIARAADGVIVGSAIIRAIDKNRGSKNLVKNVSNYVQSLASGVQK